MIRPSSTLASGLVLLSGAALAAAEIGPATPLQGAGTGTALGTGTGNGLGAGLGTGTAEIMPGAAQPGGGRSVYLKGLLNLDVLTLHNYTDGNDHAVVSDQRNDAWMRVELGAQSKFNERVEVNLTLAYNGQDATGAPTNPLPPANQPPNGQSGNVVVNEAYVKLKDFLNDPGLGLIAGRQPIRWYLNTDQPSAFLYDSAANNPVITGWDGLRIDYHFLDTITLTPTVFRLPPPYDPLSTRWSTLYSAVVSWKPANQDSLYFLASANQEHNPVLRPAVLGGVAPIGERLETYYIGMDANFDELELFGEYATQRGHQGQGTDFGGYGLSGKLLWKPDTNVSLCLQGDMLSGDADPAPHQVNHAFINTWESVQDTYIVENEKYGELSRLLDGNLIAGKAKLTYYLDPAKLVRLQLVYGNYRIKEVLPGASNSFGQEFDLTFSWNYTSDVTISLLGGMFKPGEGYRQAADTFDPATVHGTDAIFLGGINLTMIWKPQP
jgi:hypothetical protein